MGEDPTTGFDAERERNDIEEEDVLDVAEHTGFQRAVDDALGEEASVWLFACRQLFM